jgi:hypothetical protein
MSKLKSPLTLFFIVVLAIAVLALFGPEEQSLGANVRIVYLHGAWVLTAETPSLPPHWPGWQGSSPAVTSSTIGPLRWDGRASSSG